MGRDSISLCGMVNAIFATILTLFTVLTPAWAEDQKAIGVSPTAPAASEVTAALPINAADQVGDNRYAVIIGINQYADGKIPKLTTCENDAQGIYDLLTSSSTGGLPKNHASLLLGKEATAKGIKKALASLGRLPSDASVFVYFSGHGGKEGDEAFWITQDAELDALSATALSDTEIKNFFSHIASERVVVMLDCCYAAATVKDSKAVTSFDGVLSKFTGKGRPGSTNGCSRTSRARCASRLKSLGSKGQRPPRAFRWGSTQAFTRSRQHSKRILRKWKMP